MKATDLMIGDWVNSHFGIFQIKDIFEDCVRDNRGNDYEFDCIYPIVLTRDFLKINGFYLVDVFDIGHATPKANINRYERWECKTIPKNFTLLYEILERYYSLYTFNNHISHIMYVHELQHALRMCKIENKIEL